MTGATRGIGQALADSIRRRGYFVCSLARSASVDLAVSSSDHVIRWDCSLDCEENPWDELYDFVQSKTSCGFIHAAGILGPMERISSRREQAHWHAWWADYYRAFRINFSAGAELVHGLRPLLKSFPGDTIPPRPPFVMHLSSGAARKAYVGWNAYCSSKAALLMEFQCLAAEKAANELQVLSVAPGTVMTDMMRQVLSAQADDFPAVSKFKELESTGGLIHPQAAAEKIASWLLESKAGELEQWHGLLYDVRARS